MREYVTDFTSRAVEAVFCLFDLEPGRDARVWATRFILKLQKIGRRIPEDVAVIGYDNLDIASVISPSLTTIDQNHDNYAAGALRLLLDIAADRRIAMNQRTVIIPPRLIVREST